MTNEIYGRLIMGNIFYLPIDGFLICSSMYRQKRSPSNTTRTELLGKFEEKWTNSKRWILNGSLRASLFVMKQRLLQEPNPGIHGVGFDVIILAGSRSLGLLF